MLSDPLSWAPQALKARGLSEETCRKWAYGVATYKGELVQVANFYDDDGTLIGQKIRTRNKDFPTVGKVSDRLYGRHLWRDGGKRIIITEGEIDALTVSQVLAHKWAVVSVPNGAQGARKALAANLEWLLKYEEIVLCFDQDEPGKAAVEECVTLFPPGKVSVVALPLKDPNAMLTERRVEELVNALWAAKEYRPDGIISLEDAFAALDQAPEAGHLPWCIPALDDLFYGRRYGELVGLGAPTGGGKTSFLFQQITFDLLGGCDVGAFLFETSPAEAAEALANVQAEKVWAPDDPDRAAGLANARAVLTGKTELAVGKLHLYDHWGSTSWPVVRDRIRFLAQSQGVRLFYIDHITAFDTDDVKSLDNLIAEMASLCKELDVWIMYISHLATAEGTPHEEGGRVMARHFRGSRAIIFWSHVVLALERNQQKQDSLTSLRVLKGRLRAASKKRAVGTVIPLRYDPDKGKFYPAGDDDFPGSTDDDEESPF